MNSPGPISGGFPPGYAPVREPVPGPWRSADFWRMALKVVLAAVSLGSFGMLAVVPMLWLAAVNHRRLGDWVGAGLVAVTSGTGFLLTAMSQTDGDWQGNTGVPLLLGSGLGAALYVPIVDGWRQRAVRAAAAYPPFYPYPPYTAYPPYPYLTTPYPSVGYPPVPRPGGPNAPRPYPTPQPTTPLPLPPPAERAAAVGGSRIDQVRAELDELSDYLRSQEEGT